MQNVKNRGVVFVCRKIRLYDYLVKHGEMPIKISVDKFDANRLVWLFVRNDSLSMLIDKYYEELELRIEKENEENMNIVNSCAMKASKAIMYKDGKYCYEQEFRTEQ